MAAERAEAFRGDVDRAFAGRRSTGRAARRCIVTGEIGPKEAMIRFVVGPEGQVVADLSASLPGRGMWLSARRDVVNTACAKGAFAKAARRSVRTAPGLADAVEGQLARRCLDLLGLARRAGSAAVGFEKVRALLASGRAEVLVAAVDGAAAGRRKLGSLAPEMTPVELLTGAEISGALGRENAVHVALARGRLADRFVVAAARLAGFRLALGRNRTSVT